VKSERKSSVQEGTKRKTDENPSEIKTEIDDIISHRLDFDMTESDSVNVGVEFVPVDILGQHSTGINKTNKLSNILSKEIPVHDLIPGNNTNMLSNFTDSYFTFIPVTVTTKKRVRNNPRNSGKTTKKIASKENELMKLLVAVKNMTGAEIRKTIIKENQEKRRRRMKMEQRRRNQKRRKLERRLTKENSVLPKDGFHISNSKQNFLKKKYYSRCCVITHPLICNHISFL